MRNDVVLISYRDNYGETGTEYVRRSDFYVPGNWHPVNIVWDIYGEYVCDSEFSEVITYITVS